jgi:hypothetical protein
MAIQGEIKTLYTDSSKEKVLLPVTKTKAITDDQGINLDVLLASKASESFVTNKIAEAQLGGGSGGGDIDLSGYVTKDELNTAKGEINSITVSISGDTMTGKLTAPQVDIINPTNSYPRIVLSCSDGTNKGKAQYSASTSDGRAYIAEWANDSSSNYEIYSLPAPEPDLTENTNYSILTSKRAVTIAQGGTGATTAAAARTALGAVNKAGDTITGTLILSKTTDASGISNTSPALIVGGTTTTAHIAIDANEIIAKSNGTTPTTLNLGEVSTSSIISINGLFRMGTTNNYGTTLPAAGKAGRVFFKKVSS